MISSAEFAAYNRAVARIGDKAASDVESSVLAWCRANASASVAEKREAAKLIMDGYIQGYDDIAAVFAAEWYDRRAQKSGVALDQAITMTTYEPESVDAVARYQAKKLAKGGDAEFAKACGEFARNDAFRSLNETIVANVGRDKDRGARFARVPTGFETCTFCLMLASRGAVYHTRKSAGEFKHFHRGCDCKVVPSFERDPYAEVVEGFKPRELYERMREMERQTGFSFSSSKDSRKLRDFIALHDSRWILNGRTPEICYVDEGVRQKKLKDSDHVAELRTANRLRRSGIRTTFIDDEPKEYDEVKGLWQVVGLPDLDTGLEIKNVTKATSENTISKHIASLKKKRGCVQIVIDVSENQELTDEVARKMISNSLRRHGLTEALMVNHDEKIEMVTYPMK